MNEFIVDGNTTILDTMNMIDKNGRGIAYVTNEEKILLGVITDGDIRRYILKNKTVNGVASMIMNENFICLEKEQASKSTQIMKEKDITSIPIVDEKKQLLHIEFDDGKKSYDQMNVNIPVVIMAGGKGTRLYPYTHILPKPLIPIGEKTITEHIFEHFETWGCTDFSLIVNYKKEMIKAYFSELGINIQYFDEEEPCGTAGGLSLVKGKIMSTFFMSNCDIIIEENYGEILRYHKRHKNIITLVCALKKEAIPYGTVLTDEKGQITKLTEKPELEFLTNTGFYVIEPEFLELIPENTFIHITDVIQMCIDTGHNVGVYPINESAWMDMGQIEELEKMRKQIESR